MIDQLRERIGKLEMLLGQIMAIPGVKDALEEQKRAEQEAHEKALAAQDQPETTDQPPQQDSQDGPQNSGD